LPGSTATTKRNCADLQRGSIRAFAVIRCSPAMSSWPLSPGSSSGWFTNDVFFRRTSSIKMSHQQVLFYKRATGPCFQGPGGALRLHDPRVSGGRTVRPVCRVKSQGDLGRTAFGRCGASATARSTQQQLYAVLDLQFGRALERAPLESLLASLTDRARAPYEPDPPCTVWQRDRTTSIPHCDRPCFGPRALRRSGP
jgi:hypothetical protein